MPKINVYLPQDLYDEVKAANLNVSALLRDYLSVLLTDRKPGEYEKGWVSGPGGGRRAAEPSSSARYEDAASSG